MASCLFLPAVMFAQEAATDPASEFPEKFGLPGELDEDHFSALRESSPFLRTLDLSRSLVITGVARIGKEPVATLLDLETSKTTVVSTGTANSEGWQLVEVNGDLADIETLSAKIKRAGEIVSIR